MRKVATFVRDAAAVSLAAARFGPGPLAKSVYVFPKAWAWAAQHADQYDHVLAYWGNYAGTCAYLFHRLMERPVPFSIWVHAGTDLYRSPVYLREKLSYADGVITCCEFNRRFLEERYAGAGGIAAEVRQPMSRATILVHPSPGLGDGLPKLLREAMAVGTRVVASRVAGIPEALDDGRCGVLVPPADVAALADAIAGVLADEDRRRQFAARGRRRTEELFDAWRNGSRLAEHLRALRGMRGAEAALRC